ncbi:MAG: hypothetical protein R2800_05000 [Flavipsychrobacter sp.]
MIGGPVLLQAAIAGGIFLISSLIWVLGTLVLFIGLFKVANKLKELNMPYKSYKRFGIFFIVMFGFSVLKLLLTILSVVRMTYT